MPSFDAVVIGAGAAGMMCAMAAGARGRRVVLLERSDVIGRKIRISGGGRCNFTNLGTGPGHYVSENPHFARSALARYTPEHFLALVRAHGIAFHEKTLGQLFCDASAQAIIDMLVAECRAAGVTIVLDCRVQSVEKAGTFSITTNHGAFSSDSLVIATGGLSLPKIGATDFGYRIAQQFGVRVVETAPALDAFVWSASDQRQFGDLAGVSLPSVVRCRDAAFREQILFTHTGLSGPAALQASLYWHPHDAVQIDLCPEIALDALCTWFAQMQANRPRAAVDTVLADRLPKRVAERFCARCRVSNSSMAHQTAAALETLARGLKDWRVIPSGTVGYRTAEVTRGGVDTHELSSKTMESNTCPGLYFIGEVVDVTGWLGGYNFQWAWASGWVAGQAVSRVDRG